MNHLTVMTICGLMFFHCVEAAFKDFVIGPQSDERENFNEMAFGCEAEAEAEAEEKTEYVNLQDVMQEGLPDTEQLLSLLMQYAQRLGLSLEQLDQMHSMEHADPFNSEVGCSTAESSYGGQPTSWYDVFFD